MARIRPFNRANLVGYDSTHIRAPIGIGAVVWRFVVLIHLSEQRLGDNAFESIAEPDDVDAIRALLSDDFGGVTILPAVMGHGLRDPHDPSSLEINRHLPFLVYANPVAPADRYFARMEQELREAFNQGVILIERQEAFLLTSMATPG